MPESVTGLEDLNRSFGQMLGRLSAPQGALEEIGFLMLSEIRTNFEKEGRPEKWKKSRRAERQGGRTLRDSGALMNSYTMRLGQDNVAVGTNSPYAAIHQFGGETRRAARSELFQRNRVGRGPRKGRFSGGTTAGRGFSFGGHVIRIPARPHLYVSPEAERTFGQILEDHLNLE